MAPRRDPQPNTGQPDAAPTIGQPTPPSFRGRDGQSYTAPDGTVWVWHDGALGASGAPIVGGGGSWVQDTSQPQPSGTIGGTTPAGVPTGRADPGQQAQPTATASANQPQGGTLGPSTFETPPQGADDATLAAWLEQHIDAADTEIGNRSIDVDNAVADLDTAMAGGDPVAIGGARARLQAMQRRSDQAHNAQDKYLRQLDQVRDRIAKGTLTPEQRAQYDLQKQELQTRIAANRATQALEQARLNKEFNPQSVAADNALKAAQTRSDDAAARRSDAETALTQARIAAGEPAADVKNKNASTDLIGAQTGAAQTETAVNAEKLRQLKLGDLATLRSQLDEGVQAWTASGGKSGVSPQQARDAYEAAVMKATTGATPYDRQQQTAANRAGFARDAMQQGDLVGTGQQYLPGGEPGGLYSQVDAAMGQPVGDYRLQGTMSIPNAVRSLGGDVNTPYTAGQMGMQDTADFGQGQAASAATPPQGSDAAAYAAMMGGFMPQQPQQQGGQVNVAASPAVQSLGTRSPNDWRGLDGAKVLAAVRARAANPAVTAGGQ